MNYKEFQSIRSWMQKQAADDFVTPEDLAAQMETDDQWKEDLGRAVPHYQHYMNTPLSNYNATGRWNDYRPGELPWQNAAWQRLHDVAQNDIINTAASNGVTLDDDDKAFVGRIGQALYLRGQKQQQQQAAQAQQAAKAKRNVTIPGSYEPGRGFIPDAVRAKR